MRCLLAVLILIAAPGLAQAAGGDQLYAEGLYEAAIKADVARNDAHGFSDAARAALAEEAGRDQRCLPCLKRAEEFARRAIAADPKYPDARVYLAIVLGLEARIEGYGVARRRGYADQAKQALDAALAADPDNVWALAGLGGWNIEVVRGGGRFLAYLIYGATVDRGLALFGRALQQAPNNLAIRYQYALTLSGFDAVRFRGQIEQNFSRVVDGRTDTAYGRLLQKRAGELLGLLRKGDSDAFADRVRTYEGYVTTTTG
jgi:tetratricopeptide (TPR) repeat protein